MALFSPKKAPAPAVPAPQVAQAPEATVVVAAPAAPELVSAVADEPAWAQPESRSEAPEPCAYAMTYPQWLEAKWAANPYRDRYMVRAEGNEQAAKEAAASGGGDAKGAQQAYLKAVFDAPRDADVTLEMFNALPSDEIRVEAGRHFFKLSDLILTSLFPDQAQQPSAGAAYADGVAVVVGEYVRFEPDPSNHMQTSVVEGRVTNIEGSRLRIEFDVERDGDLAAYVEAGTGTFQRATAPAPQEAPPKVPDQLPPPPDEVIVTLPSATPEEGGAPAPENEAAPAKAAAKSNKSRPVLTAFFGKRKFGLWADSDDKLTGEVGGVRIVGRIGKGTNSHKPFLSVVRAEDNELLGFATALNTLGGGPVKEGVTRYMILNPANPDADDALFGRVYITDAMSPELFGKLGFLGAQTVVEPAARQRKPAMQM